MTGGYVIRSTLHFQLKKLLAVTVSIIIAFIMTAQIYGSFSNTNRYFPFLWYPMFAQPRFEGDRLVMNHRMFAVTANGARNPVTADQLGIDYWRFERLIVPAVVKGDTVRLAAPLQQIRMLHPAVRRIELEDDPMMITADGPAAAPRRIVASFDMTAIRDDSRAE